MGAQISSTKRNRLFWLGRYVERVYRSVDYLLSYYDTLIDGTAPDFHDYCRRMGITDSFASPDDFIKGYLFNATSPCSVKSYMSAAIGNGMLLREVLSTYTFAYLLMAQAELEGAEYSDGPCFELQRVLDNIMAFHGSFDDSTEVEEARNITKTGGMTERISTMIRMGADKEKLNRELMKLLNRMYKTDVDVNRASADIISKRAIEKLTIPDDILLSAVESLFVV